MSSLADLGPALMELMERREDRRSRRQLQERQMDLESRKLEAELRKMQLPKVQGGYIIYGDGRVERAPAHLSPQLESLQAAHQQGWIGDDDYEQAFHSVLMAPAVKEQSTLAREQLATQREERAEKRDVERSGIEQERLGIARAHLGLEQQREKRLAGQAGERLAMARKRAEAAAQGGDKPGLLGRYAADIKRQIDEGSLDPEEGKQLIQDFARKSAQFAPGRAGLSSESVTVTDEPLKPASVSKQTYKGEDAARYQQAQVKAGQELAQMKTQGRIYGKKDPPIESVQAYINSKDEAIERNAAYDQAGKMFPGYKKDLTIEHLPITPQPRTTLPKRPRITEERITPAPGGKKALTKDVMLRLLRETNGDIEAAKAKAAAEGYE